MYTRHLFVKIFYTDPVHDNLHKQVRIRIIFHLLKIDDIDNELYI